MGHPAQVLAHALLSSREVRHLHPRRHAEDCWPPEAVVAVPAQAPCVTPPTGVVLTLWAQAVLLGALEVPERLGRPEPYPAPAPAARLRDTPVAVDPHLRGIDRKAADRMMAHIRQAATMATASGQPITPPPGT